MSENNVQDYLEKGLYGSPQIKPDEKRKYLGTFRERIYLTMTFSEITDSKKLKDLQAELTTNPKQQLLINGLVDSAIQKKYIALAQKENCLFTLVNSDVTDHQDSIALVYAADHAVDQTCVSVTERYPDIPETKSMPAEVSPVDYEKRKNFWRRLF